MKTPCLKRGFLFFSLNQKEEFTKVLFRSLEYNYYV